MQISDIHFGQATQSQDKYIHKEVQRALLEDLKAFPAEVIVVTGDVAYSGQQSEYKEASLWLDQAMASCGAKKIYVVPGNHDIDFTQIGYLAERLCKDIRGLSLEQLNDEVGKLLGDPTSESAILAKLQAFRNFAAGYEGGDFRSGDEAYWTADLADLGPVSLRMVGLNSTLFCLMKDSPGDLVLPAKQYTAALELNSGEELIVLVHHPLEWLKNKVQAQEWIVAKSRILMMGHEHVFDIERREKGGGLARLEIRSGAVNPPGELDRYEFYYNWMEFRAEHRAGGMFLIVTVKPRRWNRTGMRFDANADQFESKDYEFQLERWRTDWESPKPEKTGEGSPQRTAQEKVEARDMSEALSRLRRMFWHELSRVERLEILVSMKLLQDPGLALTHNLERLAFDKIIRDHLEATLWDQIVAIRHLDSPNPFKKV